MTISLHVKNVHIDTTCKQFYDTFSSGFYAFSLLSAAERGVNFNNFCCRNLASSQFDVSSNTLFVVQIYHPLARSGRYCNTYVNETTSNTILIRSERNTNRPKDIKVTS
jgi:hypothetical protein